MLEKIVDALVIGSGIGGMCGAAYLAHKGYRTLVVEALPRIGGHCSTVEYKGIKVTTGVVGPGMGGPLGDLLQEVGAEVEIRQCSTPHYLINGTVMQLPERGGLKKLLSAATDDADEVDAILRAFSGCMNWAEPSASMSLRDWLLEYSQSQAVHNVFETMVASTAVVGTETISAKGFFQFIKQHQGFREWGVLPEGSIALPKALAKVVEDQGGEVWTSAPAVRIQVDNGTVRGATVSRDGEEVLVKASVVMSNCGPARTARLVGRENLDPGYLQDLENLTPTQGMMIHVSSDVPLLDYDHVLVVGARRVDALFQLTAVCPELAPPGTHYLVAGARARGSLTPLKAREELGLAIQDLKELLPAFQSHAEILMTGVFQGEWPCMCCIPGQTMSQKTPIVNLYAIGDGFISRPGMIAVVGAASSGIDAATDAAMRLESSRKG